MQESTETYSCEYERFFYATWAKVDYAGALVNAGLRDEAIQAYAEVVAAWQYQIDQSDSPKGIETLERVRDEFNDVIEKLKHPKRDFFREPIVPSDGGYPTQSSSLESCERSPASFDVEKSDTPSKSQEVWRPSQIHDVKNPSILPLWHPAKRKRSARDRRIYRIVSTIAFVAMLLWLAEVHRIPIPWHGTRRIGGSYERNHDQELHTCLPLNDVPSHLKEFNDCSVRTIWRDTDLNFLRGAYSIDAEEFVARRNHLAKALVADGIDAFLVEPGYTFKYYADVSQEDWEPWEPEERPFLMIVRPQTVDGEVKANTSFLVPSFEAERAELLDMPLDDEFVAITYEEHWNPYSTLRNSPTFPFFTDRNPKIMVDEEMRDFISRGLASIDFDVVGLGGEVEAVRQVKSHAEIRLLRAVNTGTVESVRAMRKCMIPGLTEDGVRQVLDNTLRSVNLEPFFDIVLFDEDGSNPHGGTNGSKKLGNETMVLIDVGAKLYGYSSDICRSFFPTFSNQPETDEEYASLSEVMKEKVKVWDIVLAAQSASMEALHQDSSAADIDIAARDVITGAGYGEAFTHRVGHGIGIKAHESPYLNKGNTNTTLWAGMTFTSEPGIYLVEKFGVRHEDVLLVKEGGMPDVLSGRRARSPWDP